MAIDDKTIKKLEELAMLKLTKEESTELKNDLSQMIGMIDKISELDTEGVLPLQNVHSHKQELRSDEIKQIITKEAALDNAKAKEKGYFIVPKVIKKK